MKIPERPATRIDLLDPLGVVFQVGGESGKVDMMTGSAVVGVDDIRILWLGDGLVTFTVDGTKLSYTGRVLIAWGNGS